MRPLFGVSFFSYNDPLYVITIMEKTLNNKEIFYERGGVVF
jgi:hypothetical protein